jgi:hypothetical protein
MGGHVRLIRKNRNAYKFLIGKLEGKRPRGRYWCGWEDNIKMDFKEVVLEIVDRIYLAQDRGQWQGLLNNTVVKL